LLTEANVLAKQKKAENKLTAIAPRLGDHLF
jgi:hypothetical protein